ncbi:NAD(P)-dependent alcohol dehydrogenase [Microbacterium sp.]|uniref:NAD(P)-dependent alcohol dehydrogenase n=1 Tax=Microbacterium sp. TaxID=51671 RepID=UPI003C1ABFB4
MPITTPALVVNSAAQAFERGSVQRRDVGAHDVLIDIAYAGICHSDIHQVREELGRSMFPMVPGHEIAGVVREVGAEVTKHAVGDRVGVGCFVDSCRECENCLAGEEQFCLKGSVSTYNGLQYDGSPTYGGYSTDIVVDENYVLRIPDSIPLDTAAPLLCAGITTYSPLRHWNAGPGKHVAVIGMGGLGHMAVQIAHAMGAHVTVLSRTLAKQDDGLALGADEYFAIESPDALKALRKRFDLIINTVSADIPVDRYLSTLRLDGALVFVGLPQNPLQLRVFSLVGARRSIAGSSIGGIRETQEMLDFCAAHGIGAVIETISADEVTAAYDRVVSGDVRFRFVIDTATIPQE